MASETILWILLTASVVRTLMEAPDLTAKIQAQQRGGYQQHVGQGCLNLITIAVVPALWWWYALKTNQILLGVIPSVALVTGLVGAMMSMAAAKAQTRVTP